MTLLQEYFPSLDGRIFLRLWAYPNLHTLRHLGSRLLPWLLLTTITQAENTMLWQGKILSRCLERSSWLWKLDTALKQWRIFGDAGVLSHTTGPKNPWSAMQPGVFQQLSSAYTSWGCLESQKGYKIFVVIPWTNPRGFLEAESSALLTCIFKR